MNKSNEELDIQNLLMEAPASPETPTELQRKLRQMAAKPPVRRLSVWPARFAMAGVGAIAITVFAISMNPVKASAKTYQKVLDAVGQTNTFEFSMVANENGTQHRFTIAGANGKFGMRADNGTLMQIDGSKLQIYDPKQNTVTELDMGGMVDPKTIADEIQKGISQGIKEMDLKKMLDDYGKKYGTENIHIGPILQQNGRSEYEVDLQSPREPSRVHMLVNADTDLPEQIKIEKKGDDGNWNENAAMQIQFGGSVDADLANPTFPANAKHVDLNIGNLIEKGMNGMKDGKEGMKHLGEIFKSGMGNFQGIPKSDDGDKNDKSDISR